MVIRNVFRKYGVVTLLPITIGSFLIIYLAGLDIAIPGVAQTPERRVELFIRAADKNRKRSENLEQAPFLEDYLSKTHSFREWLLFKSHFRGIGSYTDFYWNGSFELCDSRTHHWELEKITFAETADGHSSIETNHPSEPAFFVYNLVGTNKDWKIEKLNFIMTPRGEKLFSNQERESILAFENGDELFPEIPAVYDVDIGSLFDSGREFILQGERYQIATRKLDNLTLNSGLIGISSLHPSEKRFLPLANRVKPGSYGVEASFSGRDYIAFRIHFDEAETASKYQPAIFGSDPKNNTAPHRYFCYSLNLSKYLMVVFDAGDFLDVEARDLEWHHRELSKSMRLWDEEVFQNWEEGSNTQPSPLPEAAIGDSPSGSNALVLGFGSNCFCYWGIADSGEVVSLVIDLNVPIRVQEETIEFDWDISQLGKPIVHPVLSKLGITGVIKENRSGQFIYSGECYPYVGTVHKISIYNGEQLYPDKRWGVEHDYFFSGEKSVYIDVDLRSLESVRVKIELATGFRSL